MNNLAGNERNRRSEHLSAQEGVDQLYQLSNLLKCDLDKSSLVVLIRLI